MNVRGRAFVFGDHIDTDVLAPGPYMRKPLDVLAQHCLEAVDPDFSKDVRPGDIVVGGASFGIGSSREQAVQVLAELGVGAIIARSFARIFYRNAINLGVPALVCPQLEVTRGDELDVDPGAGHIRNLSTGQAWPCEKIPPQLLEILTCGGLMSWLERRLSMERRA